MRPVRLTIQAFGPYAGREVVDFREAIASGLFGIYGQTGSGKSTIFSAIVFALFGEAAKTEQEISSLRSDNADPLVSTEVEFIFDIADHRYVVRRRPDQTRPKQRGAGETKSTHEAWLFDATGLALEDISEAHAGKIIAEKKVSTVREAIINILGYGAEQFRQIVLLPQGKFETFLASKTESRLTILRELFDVSIYQHITIKLREEALATERQIRQEREISLRRLRAEEFESSAALAEGVIAAKDFHEQEVQREAKASETVIGVRTKLDLARQLDAHFQAADKAKIELDALLQIGEQIHLVRERIANARRAQALTDVEAHFRDAEIDLVKATEKREETALKSATASEAELLAVQVINEERARAGEVDELRKESEVFERHMLTLVSSIDLEQAILESSAALSAAHNSFDAIDRRCIGLSEQKRSEGENLKLAREKEEQRQRFLAENILLSAAQKTAEDYEKAEQALGVARKEANRLTLAHVESVERKANAKLSFDVAEADLTAAQAVHLASKLSPGEACPVCGSIEHPMTATGRIENTGLDKAFRDNKAAWEQLQAIEQECARRAASSAATAKEREDRLSELERPERSSADLRVSISTLKQKIQGLGPEIDIFAGETRVEALGKELANAELDREQHRRLLEDARQKDALTRDRLKQVLSTIPKELRQKQALSTALAKTHNTLTIRQTALKIAEDRAATAHEISLSSRKDAEAAADTHAQTLARCDKTRAIFEARLAESGLIDRLYQSYKPLIAEIETDTATVEDYDRRLVLARNNDIITQQTTTGNDRPDLASMEKALQGADDVHKHATHMRANAEARLRHLEKLQYEIAETLCRLEKVELESAPLRELAALFNAENVQRLDLETFAIGAMFDQVLIAANQRLGPMTNGRYTLEREMETSGGRGARRGLGIQIVDAWNGKGRSPATLSGGETFIAALALALGLSDVVEGVNGKVRLDTVFIDEGFGSLDTENESGTLDQVLQVLTNLVSQRRAVGLISHVPLVQENIPNGFYVRKEVRGSRIEIRGTT